jgi:hypothetical protein
MADNYRPNDLPQIHIGDPLYRFLTERLGLRLRHVMGFMVLFNVVQTVIIPFFHHRALQSNFLTNYDVKDVHSWLTSFITQPIVLYVYWCTVAFIPNVFKKLHNNRIIRSRTGKSVDEFLRDLETHMTSRFRNGLLLAFVVFTLAFFQFFGWSTHRFQGTYGAYPYNDFQQYVLMTIHGLLRFWFAAWAIARTLIFIDALRDWWGHFEPDVRPFHPDGAGGLSAVGNTTLQSGLMVGALGLFVGSSIMVNIYNRLGSSQLSVLVVGMFLILLIAPLAFILPIWSTHVAMRAARQRQLERLSEHINALWETVHGPGRVADEEQVAQLSDLVQLREFTQKTVPVWPFGGEIFGRYSLSLAPLWTVVIYLLVEIIFPGLLLSALGIG